jgi:hypothetical protein
MRDDIFQFGFGLILRFDDADHATADEHQSSGGQGRIAHRGNEIDRRVRGQSRILGDAILGVLVLAVPQIDAAIALVAQPGGNQVPADPGASRTLESHAAPHRRHREANAERREQREQTGLMPDLAAIAQLKRIEEVAVPQVEAILDKELQHGGSRPAVR